MWDVLFMGAFRLDPCDTVAMLECMVHVLPCVHCRRSYGHYVERNPPAACGRTEEEIARWVWAIHDLVNVKLNKREACIPFSIVQTRHAVFTTWCSPFDPIDVLAIISLQLETAEQAKAYARLAPIFQKISVLSGAPSVGAHALPTAPAEVWKHAFALCNATRRALGLAVHTERSFLEQYELCRAQGDDAAASPAASSSSTKRGRTLRQVRAAARVRR